MEPISSREYNFLQKYSGIAKKLGLSPNPDDPEHYYDYRSAIVAGINPENPGDHWSSRFKRPGHPNRYVSTEAGYIDTITGKPKVPNEISAITGKPTLSNTERVGATTAGWKGIMSAIRGAVPQYESSSNLRQLPQNPIDLPRDPEIENLVINSWTRGIDPPTKLGILEGLAKDMRSIPRSEINPTLVRKHYESLHNIPEEILTQADEIKFVPKLTQGATTDSVGSMGAHRFSPSRDTSQISLAAGHQKVSKEKLMEIEKHLKEGNVASPIHEVVHMMQRKKSLRKLFKPETVQQLDDLIKIAAERKYSESPLEFISQSMENTQATSKVLGKKLTKKQMIDDFEVITKFTHNMYK